ncbi:MAG TPA: WYL domain-containing protein [Acidobacteriota bacterium]|nr:WYL domain-containing protein [Acidobacteriota bacterium]
MSRNDQARRQWFLLQALEKPGGATIEELAKSLPADYACTTRTIRRDLQALETCFPIYTDHVDGHARWRLVEGFSRVPALQFSATEMMALVFTRDLAMPLDGTPIKEAIDSALVKVAGALPESAEEYMQNLQGWFSAGIGPHKVYLKHRERIDQLARAIGKKRTVEMRYYTAGRDKTSRRKIDPYHIWYAAGALYLIGYCHLRREVRMFAVDRILSLTVTNLPCQIPLGFNVGDYVGCALSVMRGGPLIEVELRFDRKTSAWAKDRVWHPSQKTTVDKDGRMTLVLQVADTPELIGWILSFGSGIRVMKPLILSQRVRSTAAEISNKEEPSIK